MNFSNHSLLRRVAVLFGIVQKGFSSKKALPSIKLGALEEEEGKKKVQHL